MSVRCRHCGMEEVDHCVFEPMEELSVEELEARIVKLNTLIAHWQTRLIEHDKACHEGDSDDD